MINKKKNKNAETNIIVCFFIKVFISVHGNMPYL